MLLGVFDLNATLLAETVAFRNKGFSVCLPFGKKKEAKLLVFSLASDLVELPTSWINLVHNFLPLPKKDFLAKYCSRVRYKENDYTIRCLPVAGAKKEEWLLVIEEFDIKNLGLAYTQKPNVLGDLPCAVRSQLLDKYSKALN